MRKHTIVRPLFIFVALGMPFIMVHNAMAATGDITSVENFIRSLIEVLAGVTGLIATAFFVIGGLGYITSSGNPDHLDRSKKTLIYSGIGLAITIGAFVLSNIVTTLATNAFGK